MKAFLLTVFFALSGYFAFAGGKAEQLLTELKTEINRKQAFDAQQQTKIKRLRLLLQQSGVNAGAVWPDADPKQIIIARNEKNPYLIFLYITLAVSGLSSVFFIIIIQFKKLKAKEKIIEETNARLQTINEKLIENGRIKEEYIGYFVGITSGYILKLEKLKRNIERKMMARKYEDIALSLNEINIKKEREALFSTFDETFLKIFPDFIPVFNSMFKEKDQVWPKENEVLNTDLRIFALMRLGISDCETVASILEYTANTIYVYKMRLKAKSVFTSEQFDQQIMDIKAVSIDQPVLYRKSA